jgi:hypothetical protein
MSLMATDRRYIQLTRRLCGAFRLYARGCDRIGSRGRESDWQSTRNVLDPDNPGNSWIQLSGLTPTSILVTGAPA